MVWVYLAIFIPALIAIIDWAIRKDTRRLVKYFAVSLVLILVVAGVLQLMAGEKEKQVTKYTGALNGPALTVLSTKQDIYPKLKLGESNTFIIWQGPKGQPLIKVFDDNDLIISGEKIVSPEWRGFWFPSVSIKWKVSTIIRDKNGQIIAEITNNEWKLKQDKLWDRNYNDNTLEVVNASGDVVLQVVVEKDYIQFAAKMYSRAGEGFAIGSSKLTQQDITEHQKGEELFVGAADGPKELSVGDITGTMELRPPGQPLELKINPIFKYPSDTYLGELLGK